MTLKLEFLGNLLAFVEVHEKPHACGEACQWLTAGPRCRLYGRLTSAGEGVARRHLVCIGKAFEGDPAPAWPPVALRIPESPWQP